MRWLHGSPLSKPETIDNSYQFCFKNFRFPKTFPEETMPTVAAPELSSLSLFYKEVRRLPRLDRKEEYALAMRWRKEGDREAAKRLILANLYVVAAIAREYRHFQLPEMDLIQEGTIGLMHAVKRYDPTRGYRLATYAAWWVRAAIHEFILRSWSIVRRGTTKLQRRIFAGLRHAHEAIAALEGKGREAVAKRYGISADAYQEVANAYLQRDVSLDAEGEEGIHRDQLPSPYLGPEEETANREWREKHMAQLKQVLAGLPERERLIVHQRHLVEEPATLKELALKLGVSIERVRQLEKQALAKLRARMLPGT